MKKIIFFLVLLSSLACKAEYISLFTSKPQYIFAYVKEYDEWWGPEIADEITTMINIHDYEGAKYIGILNSGESEFRKYYIDFSTVPLEQVENQKEITYYCIGEDGLTYTIIITLYRYNDDVEVRFIRPEEYEIRRIMSVIDYSKDKSPFAK